jgi:16S rRNA (cytidine1402-2'-O)-methyltransferase
VSGSLVLVATPIGNLGDLSPRAKAVLAEADRLYCEDTRRTRALLSANDISSGGRLVSLHEHNEAFRIVQVLEELESGLTLALVSDAGTPGISDPGRLLVEAAARAGCQVTTVPGPSAVLAALVVSGLATDRFVVEGFLPRRGAERAARIASFVGEERTAVLLESPRRVASTLVDLSTALGEERSVVVARELTKLHEELWRGSLGEAVSHFGDVEIKGELVLVLAGAEPKRAAPVSDEAVRHFVVEAMHDGATRRDAAHEAAATFGISRRRAYELATALVDGAAGA